MLSRSAVAAAIAQEILRVKAPVASVFRKAARDTAVQGIRIPKGTGVVVNLRTVRHKKTKTNSSRPCRPLRSHVCCSVGEIFYQPCHTHTMSPVVCLCRDGSQRTQPRLSGP